MAYGILFVATAVCDMLALIMWCF